MPQNPSTSFLGGTFQSIEGDAQTALLDARSLALHLHAPSAALPEIVFLPGLPGSVLDQTPGGTVVWVNFARALDGTLGTDLDPQPASGAPLTLTATDMIPGLYDVADLAWRAAGFTVHRFAFDWRLPLQQAAQSLRALITSRKAQRPDVRFLPVAHSQGGLAICEYARQFPDFTADFARVVFLGTPLRGTYSALDATLGSASILQNLKSLLDAVGRNGAAVADDFRRAACHMQGLVELYPDPDEFQNTAGLYDASQYPAGFQPAQPLLDAALNFRKGLLDPVLLGRSTMIMSATFPTAANDQLQGGVRTAGTPQLGDSLTTLGSGLPPGLHDAFQARLQHLWLPIDSESIQCVIEIGTQGEVDRSKHTPLTLSPAPLAAPPSASAPAPAGTLQEIAARFQKGAPRLGDLLWLFSA